MATKRARAALPPALKVGEALSRLARARALQTLVRGALPTKTLKRLLKDAMPSRAAREMPQEVWPSLAAGIAVESDGFGLMLAEHLHDRLAWDEEPKGLDEWWRLVRERPLEALWMAALSESRAVKKEFAHLVEHAIDHFRSSPECIPPSWDFVEAILDVQAQTTHDLREAEKEAEDSKRRSESERERIEEVREELKRLRRENSELRAGKALAERKGGEMQAQLQSRLATTDSARVEELERRLRKAEKEREHLARERARSAGEIVRLPESLSAEEPSEAAPQPAPPPVPPPSEDPNDRRRVLRQILKRLFRKGKIGASHTHEDNVFRGVPDHDKGVAKEAMDLLYREGLLLEKTTVTDPHVSLRPDRTAEIQAIISGRIENPRLQRFVSQ